MNIEDILKLLFIVSVFSAGVVGTVGERGNVYRVCLLVALVCLCGVALLEDGLMGLGIVLLCSLVILPVVLMLITRFIFMITWLPVRAEFPNEPRNPPVKQLTFPGAIRFMWGD
jgi:hypothetical protein